MEEILSKSEKNFGHSRQAQDHSKFKQLHKYLFVYTKGKKNTEGTRTSSSMSSTAAGMKGKASQKMALDLLGRPELASSSAAEHGMSASLFESESKSLQAARVRLSKLLEDLKLLTAEIAGLKDNSWGKKLGELENADQQLSGFLSEVRTQLAVPFPTDKQQEVPDLLAQLKELNEKASMHEKAVKLIYKTSKSLLS